MKPSESIKSISYLKAHAAEIIRDITDNQKTIIVTQNGEAKAVLQDVLTYERIQESLALLKMLAQSSESLKKGRYKPAKEASADIKARLENTG